MIYYATASEIEKLDDLAIKSGLEIRQMMELAGWNILAVMNQLRIPKDAKIVVVCGKGNKGGDGLSAARHLINHGWEVSIVLLSNELAPDPEHHLNLLKKMNVSVVNYSKEESTSAINSSDVIVDALIGYHLKGVPRGDYAEIIRVINKAGKKVIAYDIPTGIDATTGECFGPCIKADATLTLALPKKAFENEAAKKNSGQIFLADIGIPATLYDQIYKKSRPDFKAGSRLLLKF